MAPLWLEDEINQQSVVLEHELRKKGFDLEADYLDFVVRSIPKYQDLEEPLREIGEVFRTLADRHGVLSDNPNAFIQYGYIMLAEWVEKL